MDFTERTPIEAGFAQVFHAEVRPKLLALDDDRKLHLKKAYRNVAIAVAIGAALAGGVYAIWAEDGIFGYVFIGIATLIGMAIGWGIESNGWTNAVEEAIMPPICDHIGDLAYDRDGGGFSISPFRSLQIVPKYDKSSVRNRLSGTHHGTAYEMAQVSLSTESRDSDGKSSSSTVFSGLLFHIDVPVDVPGRIVLMRDRGGIGNTLAEKFSFGGTRSMPKVTFEHTAFEAAFEVYADDPSAAIAFLPTPFLDALLQIGDEQGGSKGAKAFTAGFEGRGFYMALKRSGAFMKMGGLRTPVADMEETLHAIFDDIAISHQIIDRLQGA